jgi:hypothetical protein
MSPVRRRETVLGKRGGGLRNLAGDARSHIVLFIMKGEARIHIAAPAERIWAMLADVTRMPEWSPECIRCQWLDEAAGPRVGAAFRGWNRLPMVGTWTSLNTIVACDPGRELAWAVGKDPADPNTRWQYSLSGAGDGTDVTERYEMLREPGIVRVYYRLSGRSRRLERAMEHTLRRLKASAEQS